MRGKLWSVGIITVMSIILGACSADSSRQQKSEYNMHRDVYVGPDEDSMKLWEVIGTKGPNVSATFIKSPTNRNCKVKRATGSGVTTITAYEGDTARVPLYFVKKQKINIVDQDDPLIAFSLKRANMTDVIVSQTEKPVNLLLTTHDANLWVVHSAPGVDIRSINVISHEGAGVIAPGVDPSKIKFIVTSSENRKCRPHPVRYNPNEQSYKDWQKWIRTKIGRIETRYDNEYRVEAALVGPAPLQPIAPSPIGGTIVVDGSRYHDVFWGSKAQAEVKFPPAPDNLRVHSITVK